MYTNYFFWMVKKVQYLYARNVIFKNLLFVVLTNEARLVALNAFAICGISIDKLYFPMMFLACFLYEFCNNFIRQLGLYVLLFVPLNNFQV